MPGRDEPNAGRGKGLDPRSPSARMADHAAIERLASDLLPSLIARLSGTGLGELEVREGDWRLRLRRPGGDRRPTERAGRGVRAQGREAGRTGGAPGHEPTSPSSHDAPSASGGRGAPLLATSPTVGIFRARTDLRTGLRVREGERLGIVDLLGVPQEVTAESEAVVSALFVEDGDAVEYGQPLLALEPIGSPEHEAAPLPVPVG